MAVSYFERSVCMQCPQLDPDVWYFQSRIHWLSFNFLCLSLCLCIFGGKNSTTPIYGYGKKEEKAGEMESSFHNCIALSLKWYEYSNLLLCPNRSLLTQQYSSFNPINIILKKKSHRFSLFSNKGIMDYMYKNVYCL